MSYSAPWRRWRGLAILIAAVLTLGTLRPAAADAFSLVPAYPDQPNAGPAAAKGAVIWNHGVNFLYGTEASEAPLPAFLILFRDAGWDVFRLLRPRMSEEPRSSSDEVAAVAHQLKQQGYARIVLAGQSGGAWLSLMAAGKSQDIDAVIANAPAWYGTDRPIYFNNSVFLLDYVEDIRRGRIMISYFNDDPYDPGGRAAKSDALLAAQGVPHLVLDRPDGFSGHFSGNTVLFARRFGACLLAVAGDGPMPTPASCDSHWGETPSAALPVPRHLALAEPSGGPVDAFLGKWYGYYGNGREVMLAVLGADAASVDADYIVGPGFAPQAQGAVTRRSGRIDDGALVFAGEGRSTLRCTRRADGSLEAAWKAADGDAELETVLHRVP
ncbi:MAG TPA: alpha/beta hydrolase [Stellaceae bacterium]|nr:alpha/beta hydrolase [Stellaceae bacterium]